MSQPPSRPKVAFAFAGATEQQDVLKAWRARSDERSSKVGMLTKKIASHKNQAKQTSKRTQWLAERDALNKEQDACDLQLREAFFPVFGLFQDELVQSHAATQSLCIDIRENLAATNNAMRMYSQRADSNVNLGDCPKLAHAFREALVAARKTIARYEEELQEEEAKLANGGETAAEPTSSSTVDFSTLVEAVEQQRCTLEGLYVGDNYAAIHTAFDQALLYEKERCYQRIREEQQSFSQVPGRFTLTEQKLNTVALIIKMAENARHADVHAASAGVLVERVSEVLPELSAREVTAAIEECQAARKQQRALRLVALEYRKKTNGLLGSYETALEAQRQAVVVKEEQVEERDQQAVKQAEMHGRLARERTAYEQVLKMRQADQDRATAEEQRIRDAAEAARQEELQQRLLRLREFMELQEEARRREAELEALRAEEEARQRAALAAANSERVAFRQREHVENQRQKQAKEQEIAQLRAAKEAALERFFKSVETQMGVQRDRERLVQGTESSKQVGEYVTLAQAAATSASGYTDDQIMKDPRVRLYHALLEAGLHMTAYGREVATRGFRVAPAQRTSADNPLF